MFILHIKTNNINKPSERVQLHICNNKLNKVIQLLGTYVYPELDETWHASNT